MELKFRPFRLQLTHPWSISSSVASGGRTSWDVVFAELTSKDGLRGIGEAAPSIRYHETSETVLKFLASIDPRRLSFELVEASMAYLDEVAVDNFAAKAAINLALLDGAARKAGQPVFDFLNLGFTEGRHITSFSIGMDRPEVIEEKVRAAEAFPVLKLKVGGSGDDAVIRAVREVDPNKRITGTLSLSNSRCRPALHKNRGIGFARALRFRCLPTNPIAAQTIFRAASIVSTE